MIHAHTGHIDRDDAQQPMEQRLASIDSTRRNRAGIGGATVPARERTGNHALSPHLSAPAHMPVNNASICNLLRFVQTPITTKSRELLIAEATYFKALNRGFEPARQLGRLAGSRNRNRSETAERESKAGPTILAARAVSRTNVASREFETHRFNRFRTAAISPGAPLKMRSRSPK